MESSEDEAVGGADTEPEGAGEAAGFPEGEEEGERGDEVAEQAVNSPTDKYIASKYVFRGPLILPPLSTVRCLRSFSNLRIR
ncbi:hypothetical protein D3H35_04345 [Cohnella faecalis]|uniref:Uncharacterized protein n=1 Tax=Cohnella faecalis TaxID=2315694 RepID=A0A398CRE1_9BACL|nr:hypothetical protein D3H35_04345 [Cohnella faecalis]